MPALQRLLALFVLMATPVWAQPPATVDAVQMPAWLERDGSRRPLAVGMAVRNGDTIHTGADARAYLKLAEGSTVKLGENARLALFSRSLAPQTSFKGALDVLAGAFRFTTEALLRVKSREVAVRVGTATVGIRGTDIWGRSNAQEDLVCLIEGKIDVRHAAMTEPVAMSTPLTFFVAPRGAAPLPVAAVDAAELARWSRQTEIEAGDGAVRRDGKWRLRLGSHGSEVAALAQYDAVRAAGFAARIRPLAAAAGAWNYEVEIAGFRDEAEAAKAAHRLKAAAGIDATTTR